MGRDAAMVAAQERKDETDHSLHSARATECRQAGVVRPRDIQDVRHKRTWMRKAGRVPTLVQRRRRGSHAPQEDASCNRGERPLYRQNDRGDHRRRTHGRHRRRKDLRPSDGRVRENKNRRARPVGNRITNGKSNAMEDERQKTNDRGSLSILCLKS